MVKKGLKSLDFSKKGLCAPDFFGSKNHGLGFRWGNRTRGFTLAELIIATTLLAIILVASSGIFSSFFNSLRNIRAADLVYQEANFTLERIVREIRNGTIDYEEYYNQATNFFGTGTNETYGQNFCQYSRQFYGPGPDGKFGTFDDESTGRRKAETQPPLAERIQNKLYLIDATGTKRTYIEKVDIQKKDKNGNPVGEPLGKVAMLKMVGKDYGIDHLVNNQNEPNWGPNCPPDEGERDGLIDTWVCDRGFSCMRQETPIIPLGNGGNCGPGYVEAALDTPGILDTPRKSSFVDITPQSINIVDLKFILTPQDDPRKAYNDLGVQVEPNVTVKLVAQAAPEISRTFRGNPPTIVLESTVSARATKEVITECNLQECINGDTKPCPKNTGILDGATQECQQGVWQGCADSYYLDVAQTNAKAMGLSASGLDDQLNDASFYETSGSENGSCAGDDDDCKTRRCSDEIDNDVNGETDNADSACLYYTCNNGIKDPGEVCIDVGGICSFRRETASETADTCTDGYDNDCSYLFDLTWNTLTETQRPIAEARGADENSSTAELNIALGLGADEYDQNCINYFCSNGLKDPKDPRKLVPTQIFFGPKDYETPNYLFEKEESDDLNEVCIDVGGLCDWAIPPRPVLESENTNDLCRDGYDNDCDYDKLEPEGTTGADEFDPDCRAVLCSNDFKDCDLADKGIVNADPDNLLFAYIMKYSDSECKPDSDLVQSDLDERCMDRGGICGEVPAFEYQFIDSSGNPLTSPVFSQCLDVAGVDDDCDGKANGLDTDCCPIGDNDGFFSLTASCVPTKGLIDCNDNDPSIKPGVDEVCDDAHYPAISLGDATDYPDVNLGENRIISLKGTPIDNNCSAINQLYGETAGDTGWDHDDPACCNDDDRDGFGIQGFNLYPLSKNDATVPCGASLSNLPPERINYDCDDVGLHPPVLAADINPRAPENTAELCSDGVDNGCRYIDGDILKGERKDHPDMYVDPANPVVSLKTAFDQRLYNPECCAVRSTPEGLEICDDTNSLKFPGELGSDENCNGMEGINDNVCIGNARSYFRDNLTLSAYLATGSVTDFTASWDGTTVQPDKSKGQITVSPSDSTDEQTALSASLESLLPDATCPNLIGATLTPEQFKQGTSEIRYELTNGGVNGNGDVIWSPADPITGEASFPSPGRDLKWRAFLKGDGIEADAPVIKSVTISWTCNIP